MSRYINADRLKEVLKKTWKGSSPDLSDVLHKIDRQPTVDAVEVVRCKDCLNAHLINNYPYCELWSFVMAHDNFCSFGKRKVQECD